MRISEPFSHTLYREPITAKSYITLDVGGRPRCIPVDHVTDCMDVCELCVGAEGVPSDKSQGVLILRLREDRWRRLIRFLFHFPTASMLADGLTKTGRFMQLLHFATTGIVSLRHGEETHSRKAGRRCTAIVEDRE